MAALLSFLFPLPFGSNIVAWFTDEALAQNIKVSDVYSDVAPLSGSVMRKGIEWLSSADRFRIDVPLIPNGAAEKQIATLGDVAVGLIMPGKFVVIEYEHGGTYDAKANLTSALSTKRIALCVDMEQTSRVDGKAEESPADDLGAMMVWPISYFEEKGDWEFSPGVAIIPKWQAREVLWNETDQVHPAIRYVRHRWLRRSLNRPMDVIYRQMMPEICAKLGPDQADEIIKTSTLDAVWAALGLFSSLQCRNVELEDGSRAPVLKGTESRIPVDPFHGKRKVGLGGAQWLQSSKFNLA